MKSNRNSNRPGDRAFTRRDLIAVIAVVLVLLVFAWRSFLSAKHEAMRMSCSNNLRAMDSAFKIWANDFNQDDVHFPALTPNAKGGWADCLQTSNAAALYWTNFTIMSNELGASPEVLICPADERKPATNFVGKGSRDDHGDGDFDNTHISYFMTVETNDTHPGLVHMGDRNVGPGMRPDAQYGFSSRAGAGKDVAISGDVAWSLKMHSWGNPVGMGNVQLGDGSVQATTSQALRTVFAASLNRPAQTSSASSPSPGVRVLFP